MKMIDLTITQVLTQTVKVKATDENLQVLAQKNHMHTISQILSKTKMLLSRDVKLFPGDKDSDIAKRLIAEIDRYIVDDIQFIAEESDE